MIALIDGDILAYRCGWASDNEDEGIAIFRLDELVSRILYDTGADEFRIFVSGGENFRNRINPDYKANRDGKPRPVHLGALQERLLTFWKGELIVGMEADDALGIAQTANSEAEVASVICSIDKDLHQIPGQHYNFVKNEWTIVSPLEGTRFFYKQMLIGDTVDNIIGVPRIGKVKANKLLDPIDNEIEMCELVRDKYNDDERFMMNARCLYILRRPEEEWNPPYPFTASPTAEQS